MSHRDAHLNLVESSRRLFELDPGSEIEQGDGWLFGAGRCSHPVIANAAFRLDDGLDAGELLERARSFFAARGRGFAVWARSGVPEDRDLIEAASAAGMDEVHRMPEMVLDMAAHERQDPAGIEIRRVSTPADAADFWQVAARSYASIGFPPEVFANYENHAGMATADVAAFLARVDGRPAGISMTIASHGVAGIYWVGCDEEARGRGLGRAMTATAIDAGLEMGAETASLQASPMGESLYRKMGFETVFEYRLHLCPEPSG